MEIDLSYEQAMEELSEIVEKMSSASILLDDLMKLYERGMELTAHCEKLLNGYEAKLEQISRRAQIPSKE
ncbi:MAG: exodeoxyribonuclease VII small subunit [Clostridia bacterium]|nr:exodeoxyribonuclease VII small subunit [Clostridia bacterium]